MEEEDGGGGGGSSWAEREIVNLKKKKIQVNKSLIVLSHVNKFLTVLSRRQQISFLGRSKSTLTLFQKYRDGFEKKKLKDGFDF